MSIVNHPKHYGAGSVECIDAMEALECGYLELATDYEGAITCATQAVKYIWRAPLKGKPVEDLEKALWYLVRLLRKLEPGWAPPSFIPLTRKVPQESEECVNSFVADVEKKKRERHAREARYRDAAAKFVREADPKALTIRVHHASDQCDTERGFAWPYFYDQLPTKCPICGGGFDADEGLTFVSGCVGGTSWPNTYTGPIAVLLQALVERDS